MIKKVVLFLSTLLFVHPDLESLRIHRRLYPMIASAVISGGVVGATQYAARYPDAADDIRWHALDMTLGFPMVRKVLFFNPVVVDPLIKKIRYEKFDEYLYEDNLKTEKRQEIARKLIAAECTLRIPQTEAIILGLRDGDHNKKKVKHLVPFEGTDNRENFEAMFEKEKHAHTDDKIVLYHAMVAPIYALNYIRSSFYHAQKNLEAQQNACSHKPFFFLRQPLNDKLQRAHKDFEHTSGIADQVRRTRFLSPSDSTPSDEHFYSRYHLLACSPSLINSDWEESAVYFYGTSRNIDDETVLSQSSILDGCDMPAQLKEKYKKLLEQAAKKLSYKGVMLQIILSPELTDQTTYCSQPFGYKETVISLVTGSSFKTTSEVIKSMKHNPFSINRKTDELQMRVVLTDDLLLNPEHEDVKKGFSVHAYSHDQKKLNDFHQEVDALMAELVKELHAWDGKEEPTAAQAAMRFLQKLFWPSAS